jgi:hypothetical protein
MASDKRHMKWQWLKNCNCAYGYPRDFNALSTCGNPETESEPIKNPVTGAEHRIRVVMSEGFEHHETEIAGARILKPNGGIRHSYKNSHSTLAHVEHTPEGVVHPAA